MKITYTDSGDGMVLIGFTDERGKHEIALSTGGFLQHFGQYRVLRPGFETLG